MNKTQHRRMPAEAALQPYIRNFMWLEDDLLCGETKTYKIVADGCPGLVFQENPNNFLDHRKNKLPQLFIHGLTSSNSQKTPVGSYRNICVYFQPNAIKSIFGIDASELTDRYIDLNDIVRNDLIEQLLHEKEIDNRIKILSEFFYQQISGNKYRESIKATYAIKQLNTENNPSLSKIQSELNLSERSLERVFRTNVGVSPKLFFRICRFQAALDCLRNRKNDSLTKLAYLHSYADQSHFIREFKEFTGATPRQFLSQANEQLINFPEWKF